MANFQADAATLQDTDIVALKLQFGHDCRNLGCNDTGCELCKNNPNRRCKSHFREKYVDNANRVFLASCSAPIVVRVANAATGEEYVADDTLDIPHPLEGAQLQLCLLEGLAYEQREKERGAENMTVEDYEDMLLLDNTTSARPEALLVPGKNCPGTHTVDHRLTLDFTQVDGRVEAPIFVRTSRSTQNAQGGRTRPIRMLAKAIWQDGTPILSILPDVSEPFVVTTRRTQAAEKAAIPKWTDSVNKIPGVGKETSNKLKDLHTAGLATPLLNYRINTVGELFQLIDTADIGFLNDLGRTLGLKTEKVEELQRNVRMVAREDNRKRIWGSPDYPADRLIYPCESGAPDLLQQHIEVMRDTDNEAELISTSDLDPASLQRVIEMRHVAFESWWAPGHPGWGIINEALPNGIGEPAVRDKPQFYEVASLRQQMDRQCKQRRYREPSLAESGREDSMNSALALSDASMSRSLSQSYRPSRIETESQPSNASNEFDSVSASAAMPVFPGPRSVFEDAFPSHDNFPGVDPEANVFAKSRDRPTNPAAQDIYNAPSLGQLIEQPIGLAYITSTPCFEINGPIRFKRSVSGNRYKAPTNEPGTGWINQQPHLHGNGPDIPRPPLPPSQPGSSPGVFAGLPPRPSKELRSQTSLDKVANWQQTRSISSGALGERFSLAEHLSGGLWQGLLDELSRANYDEAGELGM